MVFKRKIKLVTHNGKFHADDCLAASCLQIYFHNVKNQKTKIIRTRDQDIIYQSIKEEGIIFDVGRIYDPSKNIFDHHQIQEGLNRENGVPYSAFGLIWKHFGRDIIKNLIGHEISQNKIKNEADNQKDKEKQNLIIEKIHQETDEQFVQQICAGDNGFIDFKISRPDLGVEFKPWSFDDFIQILQFKESKPYNYSEKELLKLFKKASSTSEILIKKLIQKKYKKIKDYETVKEIYNKSENKEIVILNEPHLSWKKFIIENTNVKYVIYKSSNSDEYHVQAVPIKENSFENRKPLPQEWSLINKEELSSKLNIPGIKFVHKTGFLAVTNNIESAIKLGEKALSSKNS